MGTAIGTALTLNPLPALAIFISLGAGMAAPFLLLSYAPSTARLLPKPGAWMNTLKELLAFPLIATCIWLISIASQQGGSNAVVALLAGCTFIGFVSWWRKSLSLLAVAILIVAITLVSSQTKPSANASQANFSLAALDTIIEQEPSVFVNVTASWCITCKATEVILHKDTIQQLFADTNTVYIEADWTSPNADIAALLSRYQRNGIPLYLHFSNGQISTPHILPQILTEAVIRSALKQ